MYKRQVQTGVADQRARDGGDHRHQGRGEQRRGAHRGRREGQHRAARAGGARREQPRAHHPCRVRAAEVAAGQDPAGQRETGGDQQAEDGRREPVADRPAGRARARERQQSGHPGADHPQGAGAVHPGPEQQHQGDDHGRRRRTAEQSAGGLRAPGVHPPADRLGDAVHQVVEACLGQCLGVRAQVQHLAVGETGAGEGGLLVERGVAQPLQHPAGVVESGLLGLLAHIPQQRGQQVGDRDVGGDGQVDADVGRTYGQAAQFGHRAVGHQHNFRHPWGDFGRRTST